MTASKPSAIELAVAALTLARDTFDRYASLHMDKETIEGAQKAILNNQLAEKMRNALAALRSQQEPEGSKREGIAELRNVIECLRETGTYRDEEGEATDALADLLGILSAAPTEAEGGALMQAYAMGQRWMELMAEGNETAAADVSERFSGLLARPIQQAPSGEGEEAVHQWRTHGEIQGRWRDGKCPYSEEHQQFASIETRTLYSAPVVPARTQEDGWQAKYEALAARVNVPHTDDWFEATRLEAAHQIERWGEAHDVGKQPSDWFWLIGYLAGKALSSFVKGDAAKGLHHVISTSAALLNWHRAATGTETAMRPGHAPSVSLGESLAARTQGAK